MLRRCFSNIILLVTVAIIIIFLFIIISCSTGKWHWFGRSGALVTMVGVLLSVRPLIRMGYKEWKDSLNVISCGSLPPIPLEEQEEIKQESKDIDALHIGVIISVIGTLIWAYGDLIGGLPK